MIVSATTTGISIATVSEPISSIEISTIDDEQTLDMSLLSTSLRDIDANTDYTLSLTSDDVFSIADMFVDLDLVPVDLIKNVITINCTRSGQSSAKFSSDAPSLYRGSDALIKFEIDSGYIDNSPLLFGMFTLNGKQPLITIDSNTGITMDGNYIYVQINGTKMDIVGKFYIELSLKDSPHSNIYKGYINIDNTRL